MFIELQVFLKLRKIGFLFGVSTIGIFKQLFQGFLILSRKLFQAQFVLNIMLFNFSLKFFSFFILSSFPILFLLLFLFSHSSFFLVFLLVFVGIIMAKFSWPCLVTGSDEVSELVE